MNSISEIPGLMVEFLETCPEFKLTPRGIEIIDELADYAEQTELFKENKKSGKVFDGQSAKNVYCYMLDRVANAPTILHGYASVILIIPYVRELLNKELTGANDSNKG